VPEGPAIAGYDDPTPRMSRLPLVGAPALGTRAAEAAELLAEEISGPETHTHRQAIHEPERVVRASSQLAAGRRCGTLR
jgi:DNA-binding LacI/PurR family transcriptional regulator